MVVDKKDSVSTLTPGLFGLVKYSHTQTNLLQIQLYLQHTEHTLEDSEKCHLTKPCVKEKIKQWDHLPITLNRRTIIPLFKETAPAKDFRNVRETLCKEK